MNWENRLIGIYVKVCELFDQGLSSVAEKMSNNQKCEISDQEIISIFLNGIISKQDNLKRIFVFSENHLSEWFPNLTTYENFVKRLNFISDVFAPMVEMLVEEGSQSDENYSIHKIIDSMPIILAKGSRSTRAKVAPELANKGYCGSKDFFYYGIKLHVLGSRRAGTVPFPEFVGTTQANIHDLTAFKMFSHVLRDCDVFCDKAYIDKAANKVLKTEQNVQIAHPVKLKKGQKILDSADRLYSAAVSSIRQPIESFFNMIQEQTNIQIASKVRSSRGLLVHVFGRFAAVMLLQLHF